MTKVNVISGVEGMTDTENKSTELAILELYEYSKTPALRRGPFIRAKRLTDSFHYSLMRIPHAFSVRIFASLLPKSKFHENVSARPCISLCTFLYIV